MNPNRLQKTLFVLAILIIAASFANAQLLATVLTDKKTISTNELAKIKVVVLNQSDSNLQNVIIRLQAVDGLVFVNGTEEQTVIMQSIETLEAKATKEIEQIIKAKSTKNPSTNITVYYGTEMPLRNAAVTAIETTELPITIKATSAKKTISGEDVIEISFKLTNNSKANLLKASTEAIIPENFKVTPAPLVIETLAPNNAMEQTFSITAPPGTQGDKTIILAYGFFDANGPHYFQQNFTEKFQPINYQFIVLVGIIVACIAVYFLLKRDNSSPVKGSAEKK